MHTHTHTHTHQIKVLASFTEKETLHPVLLGLGSDVMKSCITTTKQKEEIQLSPSNHVTFFLKDN